MITIGHAIFNDREMYLYHDGNKLHRMILKDDYIFSEDGIIIFRVGDTIMKDYDLRNEHYQIFQYE